MKENLYCIIDVIAAEYSPPAPARNDLHAVRNFQTFIEKNKGTPGFSSQDFQLFRVGTFDNSTGELFPDFHRVELNLKDDE